MKRKTAKKTPRKSVKNTVKSSSECYQCSFCSLVKKFLVPIIALIVIILGSLIYFKGFFIAALVNGRPIFRHTLVRELEKQAGKNALESLVTQMLVKQEASRQKISVEESEINAEITKIEDVLKEQGQTLEAALGLRGMTKNDLIGQIKIQKMVEKMAAKEVTVSDEEVNQYLEDNKASLGETSITDEVKNSVRLQLEQDKISAKIDEWITGLQEKAKINYFLKF